MLNKDNNRRSQEEGIPIMAFTFACMWMVGFFEALLQEVFQLVILVTLGPNQPQSCILYHVMGFD